MFGRETYRCPKCDGADVRRSRWLTHDEKVRNVGRQPVRCNDCGHRYLVAASTGGLVPLVAGVGALALFSVVLAVLLTMEDRPPEQPVAPEEFSAPDSKMVDLKAAEAGDPEAQFRAANALLADADLSFAYSPKAIGFLESAAGQGHVRAMLRLGQLYRKGVGALQNFNQAAKWLEQAARSGDAQGMLEFGRLYREGVGVPQDPIQAYVWFNRAAAARDPDAPVERQAVARLLSPDEIRKAQEESAKPLTPPEAGAAKAP